MSRLEPGGFGGMGGGQGYADEVMRSPAFQQELGAQRTFMARVYGWMTIGLLLTALISLVAAAAAPQIAASGGVFLVLVIVQFGIALAMGAMVNKMPAAVAAGMFLVYSAITGVVFSILFLIYTKASIGSTFAITAGMFGTMSVIGYTTKKDLTNLGGFLFMALIGLIIACVVNMFMASPALYWLISFAGVIIFTGLTAYDTQKIKRSYATGEYGTAAFERTAVFGAFVLYLDFINLFLFLLRLLGSRRD